jgi:hypothetical protein
MYIENPNKLPGAQKKMWPSQPSFNPQVKAEKIDLHREEIPVHQTR